MAFYKIKFSVDGIVFNEYEGYMKGIKGAKTSASGAVQGNKNITIEIFDVAGRLLVKKEKGKWIEE